LVSKTEINTEVPLERPLPNNTPLEPVDTVVSSNAINQKKNENITTQSTEV
jgi:hypothetical protein